jgi:serine/threonine protein kinase
VRSAGMSTGRLGLSPGAFRDSSKPEDRFECLERIGRGSFGEVFRGVDKTTNETVAIKVIDLEQAEDEIDDIQQEIAVMAQCDSQHVTRYYGSYIAGTKLWIVMEYVGGGSVLVTPPEHILSPLVSLASVPYPRPRTGRDGLRPARGRAYPYDYARDA